MRDTAATMQERSQQLAPVDRGTLRRGIEILPTDDGADVISLMDYGIFLEFGTGLMAEGGRGRKTAWTYQRGDGAWITTNGTPAQPHMRPGYAEALAYFRREVRRRGF